MVLKSLEREGASILRAVRGLRDDRMFVSSRDFGAGPKQTATRLDPLSPHGSLANVVNMRHKLPMPATLFYTTPVGDISATIQPWPT